MNLKKEDLSKFLTKKQRERRQGLETNLHVRSFDSHMTPEEQQNLPRLPIHVILDNLRSAFNVGSIIRTADCVRAEKIHLCGYTAHPPHLKLEKTALGTISYVPWEYHPSITSAVQQIRQIDIPVIALETTNQSKTLWDFHFPIPCALIFGNEALGISHPILKLADDIVEIPMMGYKNSINVAVSFGIVVYEIQRQYWKQMLPYWLKNRDKLNGGSHEQIFNSPDHTHPGF